MIRNEIDLDALEAIAKDQLRRAPFGEVRLTPVEALALIQRLRDAEGQLKWISDEYGL